MAFDTSKAPPSIGPGRVLGRCINATWPAPAGPLFRPIGPRFLGPGRGLGQTYVSLFPVTLVSADWMCGSIQYNKKKYNEVHKSDRIQQWKKKNTRILHTIKNRFIPCLRQRNANLPKQRHLGKCTIETAYPTHWVQRSDGQNRIVFNPKTYQNYPVT